jgi:hypothetical protein
VQMHGSLCLSLAADDVPSRFRFPYKVALMRRTPEQVGCTTVISGARRDYSDEKQVPQWLLPAHRQLPGFSVLFD